MKRRGAAIPIAGLLFSLVVSGCRTAPPVAIQITGTRLPNDDARAETVLGAYLDQVEARSALRGSARVLLEGPDFKLNRPQRILVERPARLRFEVIGLFDQLVAMLVSDGRQFGFYDASSGRVSRGLVTPSLLWDLAKINLDPDEVVGLLLASPAPSYGIARASVWLEAEGRIALAFAWPDGDQRPGCGEASYRAALIEADCFVEEEALEKGGEVFFFDTDGTLSEMWALDSGGIIRFRSTFEDYAPIAGNDSVEMFPNRITIRSPGVESEARFVWKRVMLTEELSDRFFMIPERDASGRDG